MQVDLDLSPTGVAVFRQPLDEGLLVLLGGEEVGVSQRIAIGVPIRSGNRGIRPSPAIQPPLLLVHTRVDAARSIWNERRFEVVGHRQNEMKWPRRLSSREALPRECRHPPETPKGFEHLST